MTRVAGWGLAVLLLTAGPCLSSAGVIQVPEDVFRLDHALELAQNGDTVLVAPGRHSGPFHLPPGVRLEASLGAGVTVLEAPGSPWVLRAGSGGPNTAVVGFSIEGGTVGIELESGVLQVLRCRIAGVDSLGLRCGSGSLLNLISTDVIGLTLGVSVELGADAVLTSCSLIQNDLGLYAKGNDTRLSRCRFEENDVALLVHPLGSVQVGGTLRDGNDFLHNPVALENHTDTEMEIPATHNYWGTVDADSVAALIVGRAAFLPFTDASHQEVLGARP